MGKNQYYQDLFFKLSNDPIDYENISSSINNEINPSVTCQTNTTNAHMHNTNKTTTNLETQNERKYSQHHQTDKHNQLNESAINALLNNHNLAFLSFEKHKLQIIDNIQNILQTKIAPLWHEHPFVQLPFAFGINTSSFKYMSDDNIQNIKENIIKSIQQYEKRVTNVSCNIQDDTKQINNIIVHIKCTLENKQISMKISI